MNKLIYLAFICALFTFASCGNSLSNGSLLLSTDEIALTSSDTLSYALFQNDGNLVIYCSGVSGYVSWISATSNSGTAPYKLYMQGDGNVVIYDATGTAKWSSGTYGQGTGPY